MTSWLDIMFHLHLGAIHTGLGFKSGGYDWVKLSQMLIVIACFDDGTKNFCPQNCSQVLCNVFYQ